MAKIEVNVPDIGDFKDVPVIEVLVKPGDTVKVDQSLVTLESDKATMDVPSPIAGDGRRRGGQGRRQGVDGRAHRCGSTPRAQRRRRAAGRRGARIRAPPPPPARSRPRRPRRPAPGLGSGRWTGEAAISPASSPGPRCAASRANSISISRASRAPASTAASPGRTSRRRSAGAGAPVAAVGRRAAGRSGGRLRQVRSDRDRAAVAHQADFRASPARLLGQRAPRHPHATRPTSPTSRPSARRSTRTPRKTRQSPTACRCCRS